jgi:hypothetical protein
LRIALFCLAVCGSRGGGELVRNFRFSLVIQQLTSLYVTRRAKFLLLILLVLALISILCEESVCGACCEESVCGAWYCCCSSSTVGRDWFWKHLVELLVFFCYVRNPVSVPRIFCKEKAPDPGAGLVLFPQGKCLRRFVLLLLEEIDLEVSARSVVFFSSS